jgi:hypothetical protein
MRVISATFAPLPPSSSRISRDPSAKWQTHRLPGAAIAMAHTAVGKCMCPLWCDASCASCGQRVVMALPCV